MIDPITERRYSDCQELMDLWRKYHDYFKIAVGGEGITPEREHEFITIKSRIAMLHDSFMDCLDHDQNIGQNILSIVTRSITLRHIHRMSTAEIKKIELEWHESYLLLNETLGLLEDKRKRFAEVTPSEYYRRLYIRKTKRAVRDFLTSWTFKMIVAVVVIMVAIFLSMQFGLVEKIVQNPTGKKWVMKFEALIRMVHGDYPFRDIADFQRMDVGEAQNVKLREADVQKKNQYSPAAGIQRIDEAMSGSQDNVASLLRQHLDHFRHQDLAGQWDNCRAEIWAPNMMWGGSDAVVWLYRLPTTKSAVEIENKYQAWYSEVMAQSGRPPDWALFRRSNVIGVVFGGDNNGQARQWLRDQYTHQRTK
jgi:hypothetical protein